MLMTMVSVMNDVGAVIDGKEAGIMRNILSWLPIVAGVVAAVLWAASASITVTTDINSGYGSLVGVDEMSAGFRKVAKWNRLAAAAACFEVLLRRFQTGYRPLIRSWAGPTLIMGCLFSSNPTVADTVRGTPTAFGVSSTINLQIGAAHFVLARTFRLRRYCDQRRLV